MLQYLMLLRWLMYNRLLLIHDNYLKLKHVDVRFRVKVRVRNRTIRYPSLIGYDTYCTLSRGIVKSEIIHI